MSVERTALFVRVPVGLADQITTHTERAGRSKQDVVCALLEAQLDTDGTHRTARTAAPLVSQPGSLTDVQDDPEVLDLDGVAMLLALDAETVLERIADGDFPGRRLGAQWRFSRHAVMQWLAGTDPVTEQPRTGFTSI